MDTTLCKVGNSMAVLLPKALRDTASISVNDSLHIESPRKGVIVISTIVDSREDKLARLKKAHARIEARAKNMVPWPKGMTADDLIREGTSIKADEILSLEEQSDL